MNALGRHILVEFSNCKADVLSDVSAIEKAMVEAAQVAGATVINSTFHHFSPYGVSGVVVIQESHLAIHTWPEFKYAAVDLFTCGDTVDPWVSFEHLKKAFQASYSALEMNRGSTHVIKKSDDAPLQVKPSDATDYSANGPYKINRNVWFTDKDENQALSLRYTGEIFFDEKSPFQRVRILESCAYGKMLAIDDMVMCTEKDESHYHEMITHPALQAFQSVVGPVKNVLVIGGGDGGTIREVFKYPGIEKVTMVEIDEAVVRASRLHLPTLSREFSNPKLDLVIGDGIEYVRKCKPEMFDVVIVDGSDPAGPAQGLFTKEFYADCKKALKPNGVLVTQGESPMFHAKTFVELNHCLQSVFSKTSVHTLLFHSTTYPTGMWSLQMAVKGQYHPVKDHNKQMTSEFVEKNAANLNYYTDELHSAAFTLPRFVKQMLNS